MNKEPTHEEYAGQISKVIEALDLLHGKWKLAILLSLSHGKKRFNQLLKEVYPIAGKSLSRELKELEQNHFIERTLIDAYPPTTEYAITAYGKSLERVIFEFRRWGTAHTQKRNP